MDEWHPDADDWATHIADEFMIINNGSARDKPDRVALAKKQQAAGNGAPGAPITSMNMYDYGDAAVMISHHFPYQGGKPYYNVRVFVKQGTATGLWFGANRPRSKAQLQWPRSTRKSNPGPERLTFEKAERLIHKKLREARLAHATNKRVPGLSPT